MSEEARKQLALKTHELTQLMIATGIPKTIAQPALMTLVEMAFRAGTKLAEESDRDFFSILKRAVSTQNVMQWFEGTDELLTKAIGPAAVAAYKAHVEENGPAHQTEAWNALGLVLAAKFHAALDAEVKAAEAQELPALNLG
jgi:hypothetical protein